MTQKKGKFQAGKANNSAQNQKARQEKLWKQVEQQREQARRKQTMKRTLIALVALVVVVAVALAGYLIAQSGNKQSAGTQDGSGAVVSGQSPEKIAALSGKEAVEAAQGILVSDKGVYKAKAGVPTVEMWYSYACPACLNVEKQNGKDILKLAKDGKANLLLHTVVTHAIPWTVIAGEAAMQVGAQQPDKLLDFHEKLMAVAWETMFAKGEEQGWKDQGQNTIMADAGQSLAKIKEIAKQLGIKDEVIATFAADTESKRLIGWQQQWADAAGKQTKQVGTPMFASNGKLVEKPFNNDGSLNEGALLGK